MVCRRITGIYKIECEQHHNKVYIGSAIDITRRWSQHKWHLLKRTHRNRYLQRVVDKYGMDSLIFTVIEITDVADLLVREQYWIDKEQSASLGFNLNPNATSGLGRKMSEETKLKLSEANKGKHHSPEAIEKIRAASTGRSHQCSEATKAELRRQRTGSKHSAESRQKISDALKGENNPFHGRSHTEESKEKIAKTKRGKSLSIDTRNKMSLAGKGRKFTDEHKQKIGLANSKRLISDETREKMRAAKLGNKLSEETRQKMSESHKRRQNKCS